jgi:hypothetical protein
LAAVATENVNPVAVLALPEVGDQSTETLVESPKFVEVIADFDKITSQKGLAGLKLNIGSVAALLVPATVKSLAVDTVDYTIDGSAGQPPTV